MHPDAKQGDIYEYASRRTALIQSIAASITPYGGAALLCDYGYVEPAYGDTFQALYKHAHCDVFDHIGCADLTSHVDFSALMTELEQDKRISAASVTEQGAFLSRLGGAYRAQSLAQKATSETQAQAILDGYERIRSDKDMGALFKVLCFTSGGHIHAAGF